MYYPTTRVLTVLEMLQAHPRISGADIATRLEVDIRTARRYITMLEDLGIPVTADRGRDGGYRLMPGFKLPPLMLNEEEALALTLGLLAARRLGLVTQAPGVEGALAKVERVLPERIRERVRAVEETIVWDIGGRRQANLDSEVILTLGTAARRRQRVILQYRKHDGEESDRLFDPYGLACRRGRWYATGYCHLRNDMRLFRLDRVVDATIHGDEFQRPEGFDVLAEVLRNLGSVPRNLAVDVWLDTSIECARWHISAEVAVLEEAGSGGVLLRGYTDNADYMARLIASVGCPYRVRQPVELRDALRRHAVQIAECASLD